MGLPQGHPFYTIDEYLTIERASEERHEYLDGRIYAMAGESDNHGYISVNVVIGLGNQLKGSQCRLRTKDVKIRSGPEPKLPHNTKGLYSYPDIAVICGEAEHHDEHRDIILNPTALFEVLSPTTESFDRGEKFIRYQTWNPTLKDYVLIAQDRPQIEHYHRGEGGSWSYERYEGFDAGVLIPSIKCTLQLAEVYEGIDFPP